SRRSPTTTSSAVRCLAVSTMCTCTTSVTSGSSSSPPSRTGSARGTWTCCLSAPPSNTCRLLARYHAAPESTLVLTKASSLGCGRVRPLAWCSRPRSSTASLAGALVVATAQSLREQVACACRILALEGYADL